MVGGTGSAVVVGTSNRVTASYSCIAAGAPDAGITGNVITDEASFIGAGKTNTVSSPISAVIAGSNNTIGASASAGASIVGAGIGNSVIGNASAIVTGGFNTVDLNSAPGGGGSIICAGGASPVMPAIGNWMLAPGAIIGAGSSNRCGSTALGDPGTARGASATSCGIFAGQRNTIEDLAPRCIIGGGDNNTVVNADNAMIGAGELNTIGDVTLPTVDHGFIGGGLSNMVTASGAFIGAGEGNTAGGENSGIGAGCGNLTNSDCDFIGGGTGNESQAHAGFIGAGGGNTIGPSGSDAFVGAGFRNTVNGFACAVLTGGVRDHPMFGTIPGNSVEGAGNVIVGGVGCTAVGALNTIANGFANQIADPASGSFIGSGSGNLITLDDCAIGAGSDNSCYASDTFIGSGTDNRIGNTASASAIHSAIVAGDSNVIEGPDASRSCVAAGTSNSIGGTRNFIGAGDSNGISGAHSTVVAGESNTVGITGDYSGILAGRSNVVEGEANAIVSGQFNFVGVTGMTLSNNCAVLTGRFNIINGDTVDSSAIAGGFNNIIGGRNSFIGAGSDNGVSGISSAIVAGQENVLGASASTSTIAGGRNNFVNGEDSWAVGLECSTWANRSIVCGVKAHGSTFNNSFVFSGDATEGATCVAADTFNVRVGGDLFGGLMTAGTTGATGCQGVWLDIGPVPVGAVALTTVRTAETTFAGNDGYPSWSYSAGATADWAFPPPASVQDAIDRIARAVASVHGPIA
jgi:hypothetical protein